jgi:CyaY protein
MMDEQEFRREADAALGILNQALIEAGGDDDFEPDFNAGALSIEFENPPGKFVVSPNTPVRQIWVSALSRSFKLDWDPARKAFVLPDTGETLLELISSRMSDQMGKPITL